MKLLQIRISNFRSFGSEQIVHLDNETLFIGGNSTGKTALLSALSKIFSPDSSQRVLKRSDFHIDKDEDPNKIQEKKLSIEALFSFGAISTPEDRSAEANFFSGAFPDPDSGEMFMRIRLDATWTRSANREHQKLGVLTAQSSWITILSSTRWEDFLWSRRSTGPCGVSRWSDGSRQTA